MLPADGLVHSFPNLRADIVGRDTLPSTVFVGAPYSPGVLADTGHHGLVYDLLLRSAYSSWG